MNTAIHILTSLGAVSSGGMEESVFRIASHLAEMKNTRVFLYTQNDKLEPADRAVYEQIGVRLIELKPLMETVLGPQLVVKNESENYRVSSLVFTNELKKTISSCPGFHHVVVSFFISYNGFVAQNAALELNLPHVASVRGTDFSRDFFSASRFALIDYVTKKATWIVTSNSFQEQTIRRGLGRSTRIQTVLNPISVPLTSIWQPHGRPTVSIFSDAGYAFKKGTHLLVAAVEELIQEGLPLQLTIIGNKDPKEAIYWVRYCKDRNAGSIQINLQGHVPKNQIRDLLLDADIYCSATLGEGCANGSLNALALGVPMVATECGALPEISAGFDHVTLVPTGDRDALKEALRVAAGKILQNQLRPNPLQLARLHKNHSLQSEKIQWQNILQETLTQP